MGSFRVFGRGPGWNWVRFAETGGGGTLGMRELGSPMCIGTDLRPAWRDEIGFPDDSGLTFGQRGKIRLGWDWVCFAFLGRGSVNWVCFV